MEETVSRKAEKGCKDIFGVMKMFSLECVDGFAVYKQVKADQIVYFQYGQQIVYQ